MNDAIPGSNGFARSAIMALAAAMSLAMPSGPALAQDQGRPNEVRRELYEDWGVRCRTPEAETPAEEICTMVQQIRRREDDRLLVSVLIGKPKAGGASANLVLRTMHGVDLRKGIDLAVDGTSIARVPFVTCNKRFCVARIGLSQNAVNAFRRGEQATVGMKILDGPEVPLSISLVGFDEAWTRISGE